MPRDVNQAQKAHEQKLAKRQQKHEENGPLRHSAPGWLQKAQEWMLFEALLSREWNKEAALVGILVARQSSQGQIAGGTFLVDLACLGVNSAAVRLFKTYRDYEEGMRSRILSTQLMEPGDLNLMAKILDTGVAYAHQFGFEPDPVYYQARLLLGDARPEACSVPVPTGGPEGKPFFVAGPYDNVQQIMAKLTRAVGPDGFHYMVFSGSPEGFDE
jgi:hypothetical protein